MPASLPPFDVDRLQGDITLDHLIPASGATYAPLPADLRPELVAALRGRGIDQLYSHQFEAYTSVRKGNHLVVVTPTASGKTLCYNLPVLQRLLEDPERRAIYLFPTKALAQDQLAELGELVLRQRLGREEVDRPALGVLQQPLQDRQVVAQRLAARGGGHDDEVIPLPYGGVGLELVRVELVDPAASQGCD